MANAKVLLGTLILVIVGAILYPVVETFCTTAAGAAPGENETATTAYVLWGIMPIFYVLLVLGGVVASLYAAFKG